MHYIEELVDKATKLGSEDALDDLVVGRDRRTEDDDTIADTEALIEALTGRKLYEFDEDGDEDLVVRIVEAYDEAYIEAYEAGDVQVD